MPLITLVIDKAYSYENLGEMCCNLFCMVVYKNISLENHNLPQSQSQVREAWVPLPEHVQGFKPDWDRWAGHIYKDFNLIWVKKSWRWYQFWFWMIAATRDNRTRRLRSWRWDGQVEEVDYSKARGTKISTSSTTTAAGRLPAKQQLGEMLKIPK